MAFSPRRFGRVVAWLFTLVIAGAVIFPAAARAQLQMEKLDRGVVAVRRSSTEVYVGWRLFGTDPGAIAFNLYRTPDGGAPVKLTSVPRTATTDFVDTGADLAVANTYFVRPVLGGVEQEASAGFTLPAGVAIGQYLSVPLQIPAGGTTPSGEAYTYAAGDASVGDLDGDGQLEIVLKWDPSNAKDNSQGGYTGHVYLDGYKLDGTRLWRIDLGRNIRAGAHYTQFMVYDLDGDGRAEVACKTAPGTVSGTGQNVLLPGDSASADYRNGSGYILSGPEYLTIFAGPTGAALTTIPYVVPRHPTTQNPSSSQLTSLWGDGYGNRVDRFLAAVAYLDGERPSLVMCRGYYTRTVLAAFDWRDGQLTQRWLFDVPSSDPYAGQGAHSLSVADVDGDGRQEIIYGAMAVDDDGTKLHNTNLDHGDALHVSDFDPNRPGLEVFMPHENVPGNGGTGTSFRDAATGAVLWSTTATGDVGRGIAMDIDPRFPGAESWATNNANIYSAAGAVIATKPSNMFHNFAVWWDADLLRELLDGTTISKWNFTTSGRQNLLSAGGASSNNGTKATPALSGDILGDWREEVIWRSSDNSALRIFTTTIPSTTRIYTLLHDPQYRVALAWQNVAYNQPPHPGFFLGADMAPAPVPNIVLVEPTEPPPPPRDPTAITWTGAVSATWDAASENFLLTVAPAPPDSATTAFIPGDTVTFADSGSAATTISLTGTLTPASVSVATATKAYTFAGPGSLSGAAMLTKTGAAGLTLSSAHSFTGGSTLAGGTVTLGNAGALGTGSITLAGSTLAMGTLALGNDISVTADSTITGGAGNGAHALRVVTGPAGTTLTLQATSVFDLEGSLAGFAGTARLTGSGSFRFFGSSGSAATHFDLTDRSLNARSGSAFALGALSGASGSWLTGASGGGNNAAVTYTVGATGLSTVFAGTIANGNNTTALVKTGPGTLTLAGASTYTGATTISAGTLALSGSITNAATVTVASGATLHLDAGTLTTGTLTIQPGGRLTGRGTIHATVVNQGVMTVDGSGATLAFSGAVSNQGTLLLTRSASFTSSGSFTNAPTGLIDVVTGATTLPATLVNQGTVLDASAVELPTLVLGASVAAGPHALTAPTLAGHTYQLQRATQLGGPWGPIGPPQISTGSPLTFNDFTPPSATGVFYRLVIDP